MNLDLRSWSFFLFIGCVMINPLQSSMNAVDKDKISQLQQVKAKKKDRRSKNPPVENITDRRTIRPLPLAEPDLSYITEYVSFVSLCRDADISSNAHKAELSEYLNPQNVNPGDIIWVSNFDVFFYKFFPFIKNPFILIVSGNAKPFCNSLYEEIDSLLDDPRVIHVFAQNNEYVGNSTKVSHIPIGIDFHRSEYIQRSYQGITSSEDQENELKKIISKLPPTYKRIPGAFVDFNLNDSMINGLRLGYINRYFSENRTQIFDKIIESSVIEYSKDRKIIQRSDLWKIKGQYAFSISPPGLGYDCFRTWEDLALGCIVIVKTSPLDPLFDGLPVVIIQDWSEINPENFAKWLVQYGDAFTNPNYREKLTHRYWMNKIRAKQSEFKAQHGL
ncbi:MAG: hypothetical protein EBZ47_08030 [Chlamydiae bacterium]|nr:hypothetical protein [Chlamydiota bacterium]